MVSSWQFDTHGGGAERDERERLAEHTIVLWFVQLAGSRARRRHLRSRLLQHALIGWLGPRQGSLEIDRRCARCGHPSHGKPHVLGRPELQFNASSTERVAVVAVTWDMPIGVDVEPDGRVVELEVLVLAGAGVPTPGGPRERLSAWLRHEAGMKALGVGVAGRPSDEDVAWLRACHYRELSLPNGVAACVASPSERTILVKQAQLNEE